MYAQGDLLIIPVKDFPKDTKDVTPKGRVVLALGETTGHAHAFYDGGVTLLRRPTTDTAMLEQNSIPMETVEQWIEIARGKGEKPGAVLKHEEHAPIELPPGRYRVVRQREYDPQQDRYVAD